MSGFATETHPTHVRRPIALRDKEFKMALPTHLLYDLLTIVLLDLVLAGDNAVVIALAARNLPSSLQKRAVFWGTFGAVALRIVLTLLVVYLLNLPGLMLAGGLLLIPIAWKLLAPAHGEQDIAPAGNFFVALRTIILADALMGLDNVLAIAGAAKGHMGLVVIGLLISVPLVVGGSTLILKLIERFPIIIYAGAAAIAWTAGRMISHEKLWLDWSTSHGWMKHALEIVLVIAVCGGRWLVNLRGKPA
jgi:YjbE family integral membrane protein